MATGLRRGELCGLSWGDVDFDAATVRVGRSLEETARGLRIKPPKPRHGYRTLAIPASTVEIRESIAVSNSKRTFCSGWGGRMPSVSSSRSRTARHTLPTSSRGIGRMLSVIGSCRRSCSTRCANRQLCSLAVLSHIVLSHWCRSIGEVPERSNGAVSKTVVPLTGDRGFESLPLRHEFYF